MLLMAYSAGSDLEAAAVHSMQGIREAENEEEKSRSSLEPESELQSITNCQLFLAVPGTKSCAAQWQ